MSIKRDMYEALASLRGGGSKQAMKVIPEGQLPQHTVRYSFKLVLLEFPSLAADQTRTQGFLPCALDTWASKGRPPLLSRALRQCTGTIAHVMWQALPSHVHKSVSSHSLIQSKAEMATVSPLLCNFVEGHHMLDSGWQDMMQG